MSGEADPSRKRILILGANGQLGMELQRCFALTGKVTALGREACDLADFDQIRRAIVDARPEIILNAAAYTAVDRAESEPELAMRINGEAAGVIAEESRKAAALLVHYSTDYVFDGSKAGPWVEDDPVAPLNVYGASKLRGEQAIREAAEDFLIFRTSWVFSAQGANFLRTMLRLGAERDQLKIVDDQVGAPTAAAAIAQATKEALASVGSGDGKSSDYAGVYHMTGGGQTTWCGFAKAIFATAAPPNGKCWPEVIGIPSASYPTPATRPGNSVLSNEKLFSRFGVKLPPWQQSLAETLSQIS